MPTTVPKIKRKINVEIRFGRDSTGNFNLELSDQASGLMILDVNIPETYMADFISGRNIGWNDKEEKIPADYYANSDIGKIREIKEVLIPLSSKLEYKEREFLLKLEIKKWNMISKEGWKIEEDEGDWNGYRYNHTTGYYRVSAFRYV